MITKRRRFLSRSRKLIFPFIFLAFCLGVPYPAPTASGAGQADVTRNIRIVIEGRRQAAETRAAIVDGRVMAPLQAVGEALGAIVSWDGYAQTARLYMADTVMEIRVGRETISTRSIITGETRFVIADVSPRIIGDSVMVPVRAAAEGLGCRVGWNDAAATVSLTPDKPIAPFITKAEDYVPAVLENINAMRCSFGVTIDMDAVADVDFNSHMRPLIDRFTATKELNIDLSGYEATKDFTYSTYTYTVGQHNYAYVAFSGHYEFDIESVVRSGDTAGLDADGLAEYREIRHILDKVVTPVMTDYEKEEAVHDYLTAHVVYDDSPNPTDSSHRSAGALGAHVAVCDGYSKAFKVIMDLLGIECDVVYGTVNKNIGVSPAGGITFESASHAWNRVRLDGEYYLVDVTFDSTVSSGFRVPCHDYFNLTDAEMNRTHTPFLQTTKKSVSQRYNYFYYHGAVAAGKSDAARIIGAAFERGAGSVSIRGQSVTYPPLTAKDAMDEFASIYGIGERSKLSYSYWANPEVNTMYIIWD